LIAVPPWLPEMTDHHTGRSIRCGKKRYPFSRPAFF